MLLRAGRCQARRPACQARAAVTLGTGMRRRVVLAAAQPVLSELAAASYEAARSSTGSPYYQGNYQQQQQQLQQGDEQAQQQYLQGEQQYGEQQYGEQSYGEQQEGEYGYVEGQEEAQQAASSEAVLHSQAAAAAAAAEAADEEEMVLQEVTTEVEVYDKPLTLQGVVEDTSAWLRSTAPGRVAGFTAATVMVGTLALAVYRYAQKYQSARNVRKRQVARNKLLVEEMSKVLPSHREKLTPGFITGLRLRTGFSVVEMFRKYLWYLLRERKFDQAAVDDLVALKHASGLKDEDVAEALKERSQRVYDQYGTLMLNTEGMTDAGIQRKATCQALFRKLLYLTEHEPLIKQGTPAAESVDLRTIFGATSEDTARLRIVSLYENDIDLERALTVSVDDDDDTPTKPARKP